ncbi:hypothetical protein MMUR_28980 [Mycolicibacterium murale]|uniref:FAD-dependent oxidoreductase n=1 Tax=Mycolicibacterium murale TaxID=182220 RepID=A0A7I9WM06_9MYCO|nr:hypothetical protein MMUR_28980 [Mycolicibacterium murale]
MIGPDPRADGFFWYAGQGGYGIQTAPGAARLAAALIRGPPYPLTWRRWESAKGDWRRHDSWPTTAPPTRTMTAAPVRNRPETLCRGRYDAW